MPFDCSIEVFLMAQCIQYLKFTVVPVAFFLPSLPFGFDEWTV